MAKRTRQLLYSAKEAHRILSRAAEGLQRDRAAFLEAFDRPPGANEGDPVEVLEVERLFVHTIDCAKCAVTVGDHAAVCIGCRRVLETLDEATAIEAAATKASRRRSSFATRPRRRRL